MLINLRNVDCIVTIPGEPCRIRMFNRDEINISVMQLTELEKQIKNYLAWKQPLIEEVYRRQKEISEDWFIQL